MTFAFQPFLRFPVLSYSRFLPPISTAFTAAVISVAVAAPTSLAEYVGFSDSFAQSDIASDFRYSDKFTEITPVSDTLIFSPIITPPSVSAVAGGKI